MTTPIAQGPVDVNVSQHCDCDHHETCEVCVPSLYEPKKESAPEPLNWRRQMDDRTMLELAKELADTVCNEIGPVAMCKDPISFAQEVGVRLIELVKAEENEAIIAAANALENIASTSSSTRIRRVANEALKAIRARRNHG